MKRQCSCAERLPRVFHMNRRKVRKQLSPDGFFLSFGGSPVRTAAKLAGRFPGTSWWIPKPCPVLTTLAIVFASMGEGND